MSTDGKRMLRLFSISIVAYEGETPEQTKQRLQDAIIEGSLVLADSKTYAGKYPSAKTEGFSFGLSDMRKEDPFDISKSVYKPVEEPAKSVPCVRCSASGKLLSTGGGGLVNCGDCGGTGRIG